MALHQYETPDVGVIARVTGNGRFQTEIQVRGGPIHADEPVDVGGNGTGPTPYELLSAALASCTAMTLKLYAERKSWELPPFTVEVAHSLVPPAQPDGVPRDRFERHISFRSEVDPERRAQLLEIADRCPVHRTLMRGFEVATDIGPPYQHPKGEAPESHEREMEAACAD